MTPTASARVSGRTVLVLLLLAAVFGGLRGVHALAEEPQDSAVSTARVVVVGVTGRPQLTDADRAVLAAHLDDAQVGAVATRPRYVGSCAAAGWASLGAGRRTDVGGRCEPEVADGRIVDWDGYRAAAAADRGDARLGTLAEAVPGCTAAVGPGAALAAADPDGSVPAYASVAEFRAAGLRLACPVTLVDAGVESDRLVAELAARRDLTVIVTGVGPAPGSSDPALQVIYRLGASVPGYLTSDSTRRAGVVTLTDLTRTLIEAGRQGRTGPVPPVDGAPLQVRPAELTLTGIADHLAAIAALSDAVVPVYWGIFLGNLVPLGLLIGALATRRYRAAEALLAYGTVGLASLMLTGSVPWARSSAPSLALGLAYVGWAAILTAAAYGVARLARLPAGVAAVGLSVAAFTVDAALGGVMQPGSVLNSRPVFALRWYGFGNVTFAAYATSGLVLAGYLAHRLRAAGRRRAALAAVAGIGFGIVICEGWPTMGADFGGVIALTPAVLWLLLALSGVRVTWLRVLALGLAGVAAVTAISLLDWRREPDARSHLGNFVQRLIDGDAGAVVARKAVASADTILSIPGVAFLVVGAALWIAIFRYAAPRLAADFGTLPQVAVGVLITAVLGTLLNDGGIYVWVTAIGALVLPVAWFLVHAHSGGSAGWRPRASSAAPR